MAMILVIDDSAMMRHHLRVLLEEAGYQVEEWLPMSAMEVPDKVAALKPDLILTDFQMPGCNGGSVARMAQRAVPPVPVVVLTAYRDKDLEAALGKCGVKKVLHKPITRDLLLPAIRDALGTRD
jgi:DNA-binding NarL/FixJ family response regulator